MMIEAAHCLLENEDAGRSSTCLETHFLWSATWWLDDRGNMREAAAPSLIACGCYHFVST
jgi:hypothetical protein